MTQICVSKFTIIGSDNGLSPIPRQAIIWTNAGILLIGTLGTNFSEILIQIHTFSNKKMYLKMSSGKCRPFCLGLNVLIYWCVYASYNWRKCLAWHIVVQHCTTKWHAWHWTWRFIYTLPSWDQFQKHSLTELGLRLYPKSNGCAAKQPIKWRHGWGIPF